MPVSSAEADRRMHGRSQGNSETVGPTVPGRIRAVAAEDAELCP